ncbi:MAG: efflux RND transporter periplasmic adaptor subunit [Bacteroidetes bacterium]|nr:efflux RND transporter periplasmic adaptor subunit [Bacteroidota bacterium]
MRTLSTLLLLPALLLAACGDDDASIMRFTGIMDATTVRVSAETPGRLLSLHADEGEPVYRDSVLAVIETERLGYQIDQNDARLAELAHQTEAATLRLRAARIQRDNLLRRYERFRSLLAQDAVTQQTVDDLQTQVDAANAELAAAEAALAGSRSKRAQIQAGLSIVRKQQSDARITSPIDGRVLLRYAEAGELLGPGAPVFELADLRDMWTRIYMSETQLPALRLGQQVRLHVDGSDTVFEGTVSWISDKAEFTPKTILTEETRTALVYAVKVKVRNRNDILKIGMPVTVSLPRGE